MKKMLQGAMVDCAECVFGYHGDGSCGEGRGIKEKDMQGCQRGRALKKAGLTPLEEYKQERMAAGEGTRL